MPELKIPYEGIDTDDEVLMAQSQAFELAAKANTGEAIDPSSVRAAAIKASELAIAANLALLDPEPPALSHQYDEVARVLNNPSAGPMDLFHALRRAQPYDNPDISK